MYPPMRARRVHSAMRTMQQNLSGGRTRRAKLQQFLSYSIYQRLAVIVHVNRLATAFVLAHMESYF
jgi:hypothetical protein